VIIEGENIKKLATFKIDKYTLCFQAENGKYLPLQETKSGSKEYTYVH
jgi:hypothetical protein